MVLVVFHTKHCIFRDGRPTPRNRNRGLDMKDPPLIVKLDLNFSIFSIHIIHNLMHAVDGSNNECFKYSLKIRTAIYVLLKTKTCNTKEYTFPSYCS